MLAKKTKRAVAILMALSLCFGTMGTAAMAVEGTHEHKVVSRIFRTLVYRLWRE